MWAADVSHYRLSMSSPYIGVSARFGPLGCTNDTCIDASVTDAITISLITRQFNDKWL